MFMLRKLLHHTEENVDQTELWMLPYSTLMLMLVILFIVLYGYSYSNSIEYESALSELASTNPDDPRSRQIRKEIELAKSLREFIQKNHMEDKAQVIITAQHIKLKMESLALFDSGSAELKADSFALLDEMVRHLSQMGNQIIAEGHTDNIPIHNQLFNSNWELSAARSFSVVYYFLNKGIAPDRLIAHGLGEFRPAFSNDVETERAKNRRIEITIVRGGAKG